LAAIDVIEVEELLSINFTTTQTLKIKGNGDLARTLGLALAHSTELLVEASRRQAASEATRRQDLREQDGAEELGDRAVTQDMERAIKLRHLMPVLLLHTDGSTSRSVRIAAVVGGDLQRLIERAMSFARRDLGGRAGRRSGERDEAKVAKQKRVAEAIKQRGGVRKTAQIIIEKERRLHDEEALAAMREKHPRGDEQRTRAAMELGTATLAARAEPLDFTFCTAEAWTRYVMRASSVAAPGLNGLRYSHLQEAIKHTGGSEGPLAAAETELWSILLQQPERLPPDFWKLHTAGRLTALGEKLRPVSVMNTLTRAVDGALIQGLLPEVREQLVDAGQFGVGVENGLEQLVTSVVARYEVGEFVYSLDEKNAFNSVERGPMLTAVAQTIPASFAYFCHCYGRQYPQLVFRMEGNRTERINSCQGAPQGSPAGPLLFSITTMPVMKRFNTEYRSQGIRGQAFIDDTGVTGGPPEEAAAALESLQAALKDIGLETNKAKSTVTCKIFSEEHQRYVVENLGIKVAVEGITVVGVPIGTRAYQEEVVSEALVKLEFLTTAEKLGEMSGDETQVVLLVLTQSLTHRVNFLMRNVPPEVMAVVAQKHDVLSLWVLEKLLSLTTTVPFEEIAAWPLERQLNLNTLQQLQGQLPIRLGGFNLQAISNVAGAAFIGAAMETFPKLVRAMEDSERVEDGEFLENFLQTNRVRSLQRAVDVVSGMVTAAQREGLAKCFPPSWLEWAQQPLGTPPTAEILAARDFWGAGGDPHRGERAKHRHQKQISRVLATSRGEEFVQAARQPQENRGRGLMGETVRQASARALSIQGPGAGAWVTAKPAESLTTLTSEQAQLAVRNRMGVAAVVIGGCVGTGCRAQGAMSEGHFKYCMTTGGVQRQHTELLVAFCCLLTRGKILHRREDVTVFQRRRVSVSGRQLSMDITLQAGALSNSGNRRLSSKALALDVTVANPQAPSHINNTTTSSANVVGAAAAHAVSSKVQQYQGSMDPARITLCPLAFETFGRMGGDTAEVLDGLAEHVVGGRASPRYKQKGALLTYFRQVMSVALQRGMANSVIQARRRVAVREGGYAWGVVEGGFL
jgi:hypothetical protein